MIIKTPLIDGSSAVISADVISLPFGKKTRRFAIGWFKKDCWLLDLASGAFLADINAYRDNLGVTCHEVAAHNAARLILEDYTRQHGIRALTKKLNALPKLNEVQ